MIVDIVYSDNMVLQRNTHNYITGQCLDNEDVSIFKEQGIDLRVRIIHGKYVWII